MTDTHTTVLPPVLTSSQVARLFAVTRMTVNRWATAGKVPAIRTPGGHYRFARNDILDLIQKGTPQT